MSTCNTSSREYKDIINCIIEKLTSVFVALFNNQYGKCTSDKIITQDMFLNVGPDADLSNCKINIGQKIDLSSQKVCLDINQTIASFKGPDKVSLLNKVLDSTFSGTSLNSSFIKVLRDKILNSLVNIDSTINSSCAQRISVTQDQKIFILGNVKCEGSTFKFSQEAIIDAYMSCITSPVLDSLQQDYYLKKLYDESLKNADCIIDRTLHENCKNGKIKYKINIIEPPKGTGQCPYTQNSIIEEDCTIPQCEVTDWGEWSRCYGDGTQSRNRYIKVQGINCPTFVETRDCENKETRDRDIPSKEPKVVYNKVSEQGYEWLLGGWSLMNTKQKVISISLIIFLIILLIYIFIF